MSEIDKNIFIITISLSSFLYKAINFINQAKNLGSAIGTNVKNVFPSHFCSFNW